MPRPPHTFDNITPIACGEHKVRTS